MIWLGSILGFVIGALIGAALYKLFLSDTKKIQELESQLKTLQQTYDDYQHNVHEHFDTSADLFHKLTENYRDIYKHLANSAEKLCPESISSQLSFSQETQSLLSDPVDKNQQSLFSDAGEYHPPLDYATKSDPNQKGNLSEGFGLDKAHSETPSHPTHQN